MSNFSKKIFFSLISLSFLLNQHAVADHKYEYFASPANSANLVVMERCPNSNLLVPANTANLVILEKQPQRRNFLAKNEEKIEISKQNFSGALKTAGEVVLTIAVFGIVLIAFMLSLVQEVKRQPFIHVTYSY